jgi:hypothetical protein
MRRAEAQAGSLRLALCDPAQPARPDPPRPGRVVVVAVLASCACSILLAAIAPANLVLRGLLFAIALGATAVAVHLLLRTAARTRTPGGPHLVLDQRGLSIVRPSGAQDLLVPLRPSFGVTILASATRDKVVMALTAPGRVLCIGADVSSHSVVRRRLLELLPLTVTVAGDDLDMSTVLPDGTSLIVSDAEWGALLDALIATDATALERCYLSDSRGEVIVLTWDRLRTPRAVFRLDQRFDWRAWVFHEPVRMPGTMFQATSVRQGKDEVVFVSLMGPDVRASIHDAVRTRHATADDFLRRDARLSDAPIGLAPPLDRRIAIDRLFMLPLRRALDRAQAVTRPSLPGDASLR